MVGLKDSVLVDQLEFALVFQMEKTKALQKETKKAQLMDLE